MRLIIYIVAYVILLSVLGIAVVTDTVNIDVGVVNNDYHSCTKAFDLRCDFYLEYEGENLINITRTDDCIYLSNFSGC